MARRGQHDGRNDGEEQREPEQGQPLLEAWQLREARLEERPVLKSEEHLGSEDEDTGLVERILDLRAQGHRPASCPTRDASSTFRR